MTTYTFSADHVMDAYRFADEPVRVGCDKYLQEHGEPCWYVSIRSLGCSKNYRSPEDAIRGIAAEHACTNVQINRA